ncbi:MAG: wax ester/triacylglycerol synthase family O-acyltransferase [Nocardioides sp.]|jgi:diacylglycerol O-acyltransferase|uniref:WS/DGAT/MGAT family O-acyltransferase n=1 Tax=Nocardioides sp. TaxID=35761 RepID=UPI002637DAB4|nr:wax ester/triacylglycerol synthase family O-acyltransferase [Nocardioides sp.]MCW2834895.1 wax ester/triacylglycerol synthase family O-acyltransferase [Nocardioides sp.]
MSERLRPRDLAFLATESPRTPMHNATLEIFDPGESGFDYARLVDLIADRIAFVPRYRQRLQSIPGRLATPVWVDDPNFELSYHVRRSALPRPGDHDQLRELVARIASRPLDRSRPLWETYFVEGLAQGRIAILTKSHQILVDGRETVDIGQVLLDTEPDRPRLGHDEWHPQGRPDSLSLALGALTDSLENPVTILNTARANSASLIRTANATRQRFGDVAGALAGRRPVASSPINRRLSQQRRFLSIDTQLDDYKRIRRVHGGTINDVILATITGGLRGWLMTRTESMAGLKTLKAIVPMSVIDDELEPTSLGTQIAAHLVHLPISEASPVVRLHQVSYSFRAHKETGRGVGADRLAGIAGFAPTTFHALGSRVAADELRRGFHLSITNVPGPQFPLYAGGARMVETYPVHPLFPDHALSIGVTSYDGRVFYGVTADRDALPDVDTLGQCLLESLDELKESASESRQRAPRGRKKGEPAVPARGRGKKK